MGGGGGCLRDVDVLYCAVLYCIVVMLFGAEGTKEEEEGG